MANPNVLKLTKIASKKSRLIVGLMSGTSLDGLDVALCKISGSGRNTKVKLLQFATVPYSKKTKLRIRDVFAKRQIDFLTLTELNTWMGVLHGNMVLKCLAKWKVSPSKVDMVASHGQTVFHAPKRVTKGATTNSTFQIGDGDHVSVTSGIITVSDFRQKHVAAGGEGAPLAVYGDYLLFSKKGRNRILLNIGGIANFTFLPASGNSSDVFVTDTGPGNTLMDQAVRQFYSGASYDKNGSIASQGAVNKLLLDELLADRFFQLPFPKTTGPELFNLDYVNRCLRKLKIDVIKTEDLIATLLHFSAESIVQAIREVSSGKDADIFVSGGGAHNPVLLKAIQSMLPASNLFSVAKLGISGDAKEAILFAVLANETVAGNRLEFNSRLKIPSVSMGKISFPL